MSQRNSVSPPYFPHSWAVAWGQDQYGVWEEFAYKGVVQRMRWIMPGTFLMGSPDHEVGRRETEMQHSVKLTKGYWLADTACTQNLWEKVVGYNKSLFPDPNYPVFNVTWNECQNFLKILNNSLDGLNLTLPTEAQWEYACRAGSTTAYYFGDEINSSQVNCMVSDGDYNHQKIVDVRGRPCNAWGIYQMHGNVIEWCADEFEIHQSILRIDPYISNNSNNYVLKGGGWFFNAVSVRSAFREAASPDNPFNYPGFRFSRGHQNG